MEKVVLMTDGDRDGAAGRPRSFFFCCEHELFFALFFCFVCLSIYLLEYIFVSFCLFFCFVCLSVSTSTRTVLYTNAF